MLVACIRYDHHHRPTTGSFSSPVPRESWLLLTASGSVLMFSLVVAARIVCCFAAVPQRVQKCCTICDTQPTTRVQLKWHWGDTPGSC